MKEWIMGLGAKQTPSDPDGRKHRLGFWAFIVGMLVLIAVLSVIQANRADAACNSVSGTKASAGGVPSVTSKVSWCGTSSGAGARFTSASWSRSYRESPAYSFNKWFPTTFASGIAQAPDGDRNVEYRGRWVSAEFKTCLIGGACLHSYPHGVRIYAWANGNSTVRLTTAIPFAPMPRP
jgi:hypothetical protein